MPEKDASAYSWLVERRYFLLIVAVFFVLLSVITFYICYRHHAINTEQALKEDKSTANLLSLALAEHLKKIVSVMESYSNRPLLLRAVKDKNVEKAREHLVNLTKSNPDIDSLIITDRQGTLWAAYPDRPEVIGKSFAYRDWYKDVSKEWKSNISDVVQRAVAEKDLAIQISVPLFDETGQVIGILLNSQRTVSLSDLIKQVIPDPGTFITVADRKGQIVYSSQHDFKKEILLFPFYPSIKKATVANKKTVTVDAPDLRGGAQYISFSPVVNVGWTVFVGRDKHSIILSESTYYIQVTAIALLLLLSSILFIVYLRKQVMAQQITGQLQTEKELRARDQRYKSYIDVTMQLGWTTDDKGEIVEDNPSWRKYTGRSYEEFKGFGWIEDIHPDDRDHTEKIWKKAVAEKSFYETEYRIRRYDGVYRDYLARGTPLLDEDGSIREWVGVCIDITERKQTEETLRDNEAIYKTLVENIPQKIFMKNRDYRFMSINENFARDLCISPENIVGKVDYDFFSKELADKYRADDVRIFKTGKTEELEERYVVAGKETWVNTIKTPVRDKNGEIIGVFGIFWDITERKRAEEELRRLNEELLRSNRELEQFAYVASHDLQEPLRMVSSYTQLLAKRYEGQLDQDAHDFIHYAVDGANRMQRLIQDLLAYSRITTRGSPIVPLDLHEALGEAIANLQTVINESSAMVTNGELPTVNADRTQLVQVLQNLVGNAIKFRKEDEPPRVHVIAERVGTEWIISVKDNGIGIDPEYFNRIFTIFQRLHGKQEYPGTGIGLAICKRIVMRHGGKIWVESAPGDGATFRFTLKV